MLKAFALGRVVYLYGIVFTAIMLNSCSTGNNNQELTSLLEKSLIKSKQTISDNTRTIIAAQKEKLSNPMCPGWLQKWDSVSNAISYVTNSTQEYLQQVKQVITEGKDGTNFDPGWRIKKMKVSIKALDSTVFKHFGEQINNISVEFDSISAGRKDYLFKIPSKKALALLTKLQTDIAILENSLINYCYSQGCSGVAYIDDFYSAIVNQNAKHFKIGDKLEVTAGIGSFSSSIDPSVTFFGKNLGSNMNGVYTYKLNVSGKPGKYTIPIEMSFTDPTGLKKNMSSVVEYYIDE